MYPMHRREISVCLCVCGRLLGALRRVDKRTRIRGGWGHRCQFRPLILEVHLAVRDLIGCAPRRDLSRAGLQAGGCVSRANAKKWNHSLLLGRHRRRVPRGCRAMFGCVGMLVTSLELFNFTCGFGCAGMCKSVKVQREIWALICTVHVSRPSPSPLWQMTTLLFQMANPASSPKSIRGHVDRATATNMNKHSCITSGWTQTYRPVLTLLRPCVLTLSIRLTASETNPKL